MNLIEIIKSVIIGIVQGITEWLPISSTGHMILLDEFIKLNVTKSFLDMFLVVIQLGSILAVIYLYFNRLNPFSKGKNEQEKKETFSLWLKVVVGCIPAAVVGFLFDDFIHEKLYSPTTVALTLILYGILFIIVENQKKNYPLNKLNKLNYKTAFLIGIFQVLALIPGTSRSGATIIGASILGASRSVAAEYSFFLAIPVMFGASGFKFLKYVLKVGMSFSITESLILVFGMLSAFFVSVWAIKFLMNYIKKHDFKAFGYYRIILGIIVLLYFTMFN
ncbi:undecaprenyl-diphosphatase 1 [Clostridium sp. CAG:557]|jgi:undecaprenyl-diphosphatase|nr:undecaprenyl-diphosphatase 1 [Clostridium sp. CAG:557]